MGLQKYLSLLTTLNTKPKMNEINGSLVITNQHKTPPNFLTKNQSNKIKQIHCVRIFLFINAEIFFIF